MNEEDEINEPAPRRQVRVPESIKDYREMMRVITKRPIKLICILTAHWNMGVYQSMYADLKYERDKSKHAMICNWYMKASRPKVINSDKRSILSCK
jgi:hypothetical protein